MVKTDMTVDSAAPLWKADYLAMIEAGVSPIAARRNLKVSKARYEVEKALDKDFEAAEAEYVDFMKNKIETEVIRRGVEGFDKPIVYKGVITGTYKEYSDALLLAAAKKFDPTGYIDRNHSVVDAKVEVTIRSMNDLLPEGYEDAVVVNADVTDTPSGASAPRVTVVPAQENPYDLSDL